MSDKLYSAYNGDKIMDLENPNTASALQTAVGGGGSGGIFEIILTPTEYEGQFSSPCTVEELEDANNTGKSFIVKMTDFQGKVQTVFNGVVPFLSARVATNDAIFLLPSEISGISTSNPMLEYILLKGVVKDAESTFDWYIDVIEISSTIID